MSDELNSKGQDIIPDVEELIAKFGGLRPMASKLGIPVTTVQGWKKRGVIPSARYEEILEAAEKNNIDLGEFGLSDKEDDEGGDADADADDHGKPPKFLSSVDDEADNHLKNNNKNEEINVNYQQMKSGQGNISAKKSAKKDMFGIENKDVEGLADIQWIEQRVSKVAIKLFAASMILFMVIVAAVFWPTSEKIKEQDKKIKKLEKGISDIKTAGAENSDSSAENGFRVLEDIKQQAGSLQGKITELSQQASVIKGVIDDVNNGKLHERVTEIERAVSSLGEYKTNLSSVMDRVNGLSKTVEGQKTLSKSVDQLKDLVDNMQGRMESLDIALANAREKGNALGQTLDGVPGNELKAAAMLLTMTQFRDSLGRNEKPFDDDLELLIELVGEDNPELAEALKRLAPASKEGVLTPSGLSNELKTMTGDLVVASLKGENISIRERAKAGFNNVLQVEKGGELVTGSEPQIVINKAQKQLEQGDIESAVNSLEYFKGTDAEKLLEPFLSKAQMSLKANDVKKIIDGVISSSTKGLSGSRIPYSVQGNGKLPFSIDNGKMKGFSTFVPGTSNDKIYID